MAEHGYIVKFVSDKLPILDSLPELFPVWRHLILHTGQFFSVLSSIPNLSIKKSVVFCLSSATFVTATVVSFDKIFELIKYIFDIEVPYPPINMLGEILIELGAFVWFLITGLLTTIMFFAATKIFRSKVRFVQLFVATLYMNTFLITISALFLLVLLIIISFSRFDVMSVQIGAARIPFGEPKIQQTFALTAWIFLCYLWNGLIAPVFTYLYLARMTSLPARRIAIASLLSPLIVLIILLLVSYVIHLGIVFARPG